MRRLAFALPLLLLLAAAPAARAGDPPTGRELEVLRTFVTSLREELVTRILPRFPRETRRLDALIEGYSGETRRAGPLYRDGRGLKTAAWRLEDGIQDTLVQDLATLEPHHEATPEVELLLERVQEIVDLRKGDAFFAEASHFRTAMGRFRVRLESLLHLCDLAGRSLGMTLAEVEGKGGAQAGPSFGGLSTGD